jgi:hypothetical protein
MFRYVAVVLDGALVRGREIRQRSRPADVALLELTFELRGGYAPHQEIQGVREALRS